jgi:GH35 family endo-1,4-beta-xylanase
MCFSHIRTRLLGLGALLLAVSGSPAGADDAQLLKDAAGRIEAQRKADMTVVVLDPAGKAVPSASVQVEQTRHAFLFGCNIFMWGRLRNPAIEAAYRDRFADVFNFATIGFYWPMYESKQGKPNHAYAEDVAHWCREHGITPKGHPLAWNFADPRWLPDEPEQVRTLQMARIDDCVGRFQGLIDVWDVVNEATHFERDEFRKTAPKMSRMWAHVGREAFVLEAFRHARGANSHGTFLLNDYRVDEPFAELIQRLIDQSNGERPFTTIGIQSHMHGGTWSNTKIWTVCERFARFGVPLHFTEMTILSGDRRNERQGKPWPSTPAGEKYQADEVERFYTMLFSHPALAAITWWDFSDLGAWKDAPAGFLRRDLSPKPSYERLHSLIKERWWTKASLTANDRGEATTRAFLGEYRVTVKDASGRRATASLTVGKGLNRHEVRLH